MVCAPVRSIIPSLKLGDYLSVQAHNPCSIPHVNVLRKRINFTEGVIITISSGAGQMKECCFGRKASVNTVPR